MPSEEEIPSGLQEVKPCYMGCDPGYAAGAICVLHEDLDSIIFFDIGESLTDMCHFFDVWACNIRIAFLEKVNSSPAMGVTSAFNFGKGVGWVEALLTSRQIPYECVSPQKWLTVTGDRPVKEALPWDGDQKTRTAIRSKNKREGKKATYEWCKKKFPNAELRSFSKDSNRADALAIAYYCWKEYSGV